MTPHRAVVLWRQEKWLGLRAGPVVLVVYLSWFWLRPCVRLFISRSAHAWICRVGPVQVAVFWGLP